MLLKMSLPGAVVCVDNMVLEVWLLRIFRDWYKTRHWTGREGWSRWCLGTADYWEWLAWWHATVKE